MAVTTAIVAGAAAVGGAALKAKGAKKAAKAQAKAAQQASAETRASEERASALLAPYRETDIQAMGQQKALLGLGGDTAAAAKAYEDYRKSTGYQFRLGEGEKAIERSAAARGGLGSGATLKALQRYGQDYAASDFGDYYNRLQGIGGQRMAAAGQTGENIIGAGQTIGGYLTDAGRARAQGAIGKYGAYAEGLQGIGQAVGGAFGGMGGR